MPFFVSELWLWKVQFLHSDRAFRVYDALPGATSSVCPGLRKECLNRNHWTNLLEARVVIGDFKDDHNHRHRHSSLGYKTPAEYAAQCTHTQHPVECEIN
jgi:transposase InsO family protein